MLQFVDYQLLAPAAHFLGAHVQIVGVALQRTALVQTHPLAVRSLPFLQQRTRLRRIEDAPLGDVLLQQLALDLLLQIKCALLQREPFIQSQRNARLRVQRIGLHRQHFQRHRILTLGNALQLCLAQQAGLLHHDRAIGAYGLALAVQQVQMRQHRLLLRGGEILVVLDLALAFIALGAQEIHSDRKLIIDAGRQLQAGAQFFLLLLGQFR